MQQIDARILKARAALIMSQPFFGALAMRLIVQERKDIKTMATDGTFLYYCRAFLDWVSEADLIFVVAHEVLHCALSHMTRRGNRRWDLWQAATDHVVNLLLQEAGFKIPEWVKYCDPRFRGLGVEEVYAILENEEPKQPQQDEEQDDDQDQQQDQEEDQQKGDGQNEEDEDAETPQDSQEDGDDQSQDDQDDTNDGASGDSSDPGEGSENGNVGQGANSDVKEDGTGGDNDQGKPQEGGQGSQSTDDKPVGQPSPSYGDNPGGCGEVLDAAPPYNQEKLDDVASEWQVYTRQAANIARRAGEGRAPGFVEEIVEELNNPQTDWRDTFRRFVDPMTSTKDYTWTRPSIRQMTLGYYTPGLISDGVNHVALIVDSSYSISSEWLKKFASESQAALDDGAVDKVTLIFADTEVKKTTEYAKGEIMDFTVPGRGGTRFSPVLEWVKDNIPDVSVVVYLTDLDCTDFGEEPFFPVLWAAYDDNPIVLKQRMEKVPFGEIVELRQ